MVVRVIDDAGVIMGVAIMMMGFAVRLLNFVVFIPNHPPCMVVEVLVISFLVVRAGERNIWISVELVIRIVMIEP